MESSFNLFRVEKEKQEEARKLKERRSLISAIEKTKEKGLRPVMGEIKTKSPSEGEISEVDVEEAVRQIEAGGACAISVLTDRNFGGDLEDLKKVKKMVKVPVLRKDFIVDEFQLKESYACGADAVLLITTLLKERTGNFVKKARKLGMESLVEIHTEEDLKYALQSGAKLLGINNRDLKTLQVELGTTKKLIEKIPQRKIKVSESGIKNKEALERVFKAGADAVLIGSSIMKAENIKSKVRELVENG